MSDHDRACKQNVYRLIGFVDFEAVPDLDFAAGAYQLEVPIGLACLLVLPVKLEYAWLAFLSRDLREIATCQQLPCWHPVQWVDKFGLEFSDVCEHMRLGVCDELDLTLPFKSVHLHRNSSSLLT
jgi:hypothetical protein